MLLSQIYASRAIEKCYGTVFCILFFQSYEAKFYNHCYSQINYLAFVDFEHIANSVILYLIVYFEHGKSEVT